MRGRTWSAGCGTPPGRCLPGHVLNLLRVISITDPANLRSLAVMRRLGMVFDHQAEIEDMGMIFQAVIYAITAEQWRSRAAARRRGVH